MPFCTPRSFVSACHEGRGCTPRSCLSACRGGRGCTPSSGFSACREGRGCTSRSAFSACRGGRGCTSRSGFSACRGGRGCTSRSGFSACRGGRGCTPRSPFFAYREVRGCTSRIGFSPCRAGIALVPLFACDNLPRAPKCAKRRRVEKVVAFSWTRRLKKTSRGFLTSYRLVVFLMTWTSLSLDGRSRLATHMHFSLDDKTVVQRALPTLHLCAVSDLTSSYSGRQHGVHSRAVRRCRDGRPSVSACARARLIIETVDGEPSSRGVAVAWRRACERGEGLR